MGIDFGLLNTKTNVMGDFLKGSQMATQLKESQNQYNMQDELYQLSQNPAPKYEDYDNIMKRFPMLSETVKAPMASITDQRKRAAEQRFAPIWAAVQNGRFDIADQLFGEGIDAARNSGDEENAKAAETMRKIFQQDKNMGKTVLGIMGTAVAPDTMKGIMANRKLDSEEIKNMAAAQRDMVGAQGEQLKNQFYPAQTQAEIDAKIASRNQNIVETNLAPQKQQVAQQQADASTLNAQTEAAKYNNPNLSPDAAKIVNDSVKVAGAAARDGRELGDTLKILDENKAAMESYLGSGKSWTEWRNEFANSPGAPYTVDYDNIRRMYEKVKGSEVSEILSQRAGEASDSDVRLAMGSLPPENTDPKVMISYMRGMKKLQDIIAARENMKAQWVKQNGDLSAASKDMQIGGTRIAAGTMFNDVYDKILDKTGTVAKAQSQRMDPTTTINKAFPTADQNDAVAFARKLREQGWTNESSVGGD